MTARKNQVLYEYARHRLVGIPGYMMPIRSYYIERKFGEKWKMLCPVENFADAYWALGRLEWPRIPQ